MSRRTWARGRKVLSGGSWTGGRGGGETESQGLMATERYGRDNWAIDIDKSDPERFSVAVEGHDVLR